MTGEQDILQHLLQKAYTDDALDQAARAQYEKLVLRFPEDGAELELSLNDLDEAREKTLRNLADTGYTTQSLRYHGPGGGHILHVNLRGGKYLELANDKQSVVVGMHDSGKRETFSTGAVRDTAEGKPRIDLISPFATEKLAEWLTAGAKKYGPRNWEKGISLERHLQSLLRHLTKFQQGVDDGEDHLVAVFCNAMFMVHTREMVRKGVLPKSLLDMPDYHAMPPGHNNGDEPLDY
ncbi:MAG TPA: hypothetical protein DEB39_10620 [Planctomycetaceae bacterium]|nr:hypothetical protein [Planctomycetaceae bacterium]